MTFEEIWNWSFLERMMRPPGAPEYVPPVLNRSMDQPLYYVADVLDHLIAFPMNATWISAYLVGVALRWACMQIDYYTMLLDANTTPHVAAFTNFIGFPTADLPLWYKSGVVTREYHNYCCDSTYRAYPTYEIGRLLNEKWHITFDPSRLGPLGLNADQRSLRPPIMCVGTDFAFGELRGSIHFGFKMNGNAFAIDTVGTHHAGLHSSRSTPQLGIWLNLDFYEYNSAPAPRGPIDLNRLLR